ncbi:MAG: peptidase C45 [Deltaproteobacteria bacterium]|nr:peptidase C45 [Deltaproteobacteria bacterium]
MTKDRPFYRKKRYLFPFLVVVITGILVIWYAIATSISPPTISNKRSLSWQVEQPDSGFHRCEDNWLKQSQSGLWELYLQGAPFDRGVANGKLCRQLIYKQEDAFVEKIRQMVPSTLYQRFLKYFIYWFNHNLDRYLMEEFKEEIYGISLSASDSFNFIGTPYQRLLNYHSAHDIGHALQELMLVGCTSFGVWDEFSSDSALLIGRNFDFYVGDAFAENKIVCFKKPDNGYGFMIITWGGMIGAVSGMNTQGITVTINAAKSEIPMSARTPISILAREILQYAASIDDAYQIARGGETFVSGSILIGSGDENRAAVIEKAPFGIALVEPSQHYIICANHFQDVEFSQDPLNLENIRDNASMYRFRRVTQEITKLMPMDVQDAAILLRDRQGINGTSLGMGNEKAINQLIAHHSVIFKPATRQVWVSTSPWQLGSYVCYDLTKIFSTFATLQKRVEITEKELTIPADPFLGSEDYQRLLRFRKMRSELLTILKEKDPPQPDPTFFETFHSTNPDYYEVYSLTGDYLLHAGKPDEAIAYYRKALTLEVPRWGEKEKILRSMTMCTGQ